MRRFILTIVALVVIIAMYAQDDHIAYFTYYVNTTIQVEAELPSTIDEVLEEFNPELKSSNCPIEFEETLKEYIADNLILEDEDGDTLQVADIELLENDSSLEEDTYLLTYEGDELTAVTNTVLFDVNNDQVNYNTVIHSAGQSDFKSTSKKASFKLSSQAVFRYLYLFIIGIPLAILFLAEIKSNTAK